MTEGIGVTPNTVSNVERNITPATNWNSIPEYDHMKKLRSLGLGEKFFSRVGSNPLHCRVFSVVNSSMAPYICEDDVVVMDTTRTRIEDGPGGIYHVVIGGKAYLRQARVASNERRIFNTHDSRDKKVFIPPNELHRLSVLGLVIYRAGTGILPSPPVESDAVNPGAVQDMRAVPELNEPPPNQRPATQAFTHYLERALLGKR